MADRSGKLMSQSKVSRIERGRRLPTLPILEEWLRLTEATQEERQELAELWQRTMTTAVSRGEYRPFEKQRDIAELERECSHIQTFQPVVIPGLLQTAEYARRVMSMGYSGRADKQAVAARLERQSVLYDESKRFDFLITEGAMRWRPPGMDMRPQLDRLASVASLDTVSVSVVPFEAPLPFLNQFILWDDAFATIETFTTQLEVRESHDLERLREVWRRLQEISTPFDQVR
jgi:hypothetical protein